MSAEDKINSRIFIGTSGYYYEDWRDVFYPRELANADMLGFYSQHFKCVEINASYYKIPGIQTFERMRNKTPADFQFIVKTHQETTHRRIENKTALHKLAESVKPLIEAGKFSGYLAQFPYSFKNTEQNRKYLIETKELTGTSALFVEFRNSSWIKSPIADFLHKNDIGYVNVDQPPLPGLLPAQDSVTSDSGYIRFHGRNEKDWWQGKGSARYDYDYAEEELKEWLTNISNILRKTYKTYIFFNNHPNGQAVKNAKQMIEILKSKALISS
jgi:uncharacterized protein YecE (DUF72 family)